MKPALLFLTIILTAFSFPVNKPEAACSFADEVTKVLRRQIMDDVVDALKQVSVTVTVASSPRSAGGKHDFFSEKNY